MSYPSQRGLWCTAGGVCAGAAWALHADTVQMADQLAVATTPLLVATGATLLAIISPVHLLHRPGLVSFGDTMHSERLRFWIFIMYVMHFSTCGYAVTQTLRDPSWYTCSIVVQTILMGMSSVCMLARSNPTATTPT